MGYLHINNLYKDNRITLFKQCYALEKIHGTSAHIAWKDNRLRLFSGGASHVNFSKLFNQIELSQKFIETFTNKNVTIFGEAYGGKEQGMSQTYGKELKFIVFDVQVDGCWLDVINAELVAQSFGLEFVHYDIIDTDIATLNSARDKPSTQAKRNGIEEDKISEGVVLRPLIEVTLNNGERLICKHKNDIYRETKSVRQLTDEQLKILGGAEEIANEWVTEMRLSHVLDKLHTNGVGDIDISDTGKVIEAMLEDVLRESKDEIIQSTEAMRAIKKRAAILYKQRLNK